MRIGLVGGSKRPLLLQVDGSFVTTNAQARNLSVTPPAGTSMLIACLAFRMNNTSVTPLTPTWGGNAMTAARAWRGVSSRVYQGIYYYLNPGTSALNINMDNNSGTNWQCSFMRAFSLINANSIGDTGNDQSISGLGALSIALTLGNSPFVLANYMSTYDSVGPSPTGSYTNLTEDLMGSETSETCACSSYNNTALAGALSVGVGVNWGNNLFQGMQAVEVRK